MNKNLVTYFIIFLILISLFGFNFFLSLIGNLLLLVFLIPLLILSVLWISFNSLKTNTCNQCGTVTLGINNTCINCGADLDNTNSKNSENLKKPSETTIEVKAEEIK